MSSNSIKSYQTCSIHPLEEEKNVCTNRRCLTAKDVKLICFDCFENHLQQKGNNEHKKIHHSKFLLDAESKLKQYENINEKSMAQIQQSKESYIAILDNMLENIQQQIESQKKYFQGILEQEIAICLSNKEKANEALKGEQNASNFQNFIYFFILDEKNLEKQINEHNKDLQQKIKYYVDELDLIHKEFCKYQFDSQIYQQMEPFEIKITPIPGQEVKIDQCEIHKVECNYMCTDALCSIQKPQKPHCIMCIHNEHQKLAYEHTIKQIYDVRAEQEQKINRIAQLKEKTKNDLSKQLEEVIKDIENQQNTANAKFHEMKKRAHEIYEEIILKYVNKIETAEYLIGEIDKKLLQKSIQEIDDDAQNWIVYFGKKISEIHLSELDYKIKIDSIQNQQDKYQQQIQDLKSQILTLKSQKQDLDSKIRVDQVTRLEEFIKAVLVKYENIFTNMLNNQDTDSGKKESILAILTIVSEVQKIVKENGQAQASMKYDLMEIKKNQKPPFSFPSLKDQPPTQVPPFFQSSDQPSTFAQTSQNLNQGRGTNPTSKS